MRARVDAYGRLAWIAAAGGAFRGLWRAQGAAAAIACVASTKGSGTTAVGSPRISTVHEWLPLPESQSQGISHKHNWTHGVCLPLSFILAFAYGDQEQGLPEGAGAALRFLKRMPGRLGFFPCPTLHAYQRLVALAAVAPPPLACWHGPRCRRLFQGVLLRARDRAGAPARPAGPGNAE